MEFEAKSFDKALIEIADGPERGTDELSFEQHGRFKAEKPLDVFLSHDGLSHVIKKQIANGAKTSGGVPVGVAYMQDVYVHARTGIIFDLRNKVCWRGHLLNQSNLVFTRSISHHFEWGEDQSSVLLDESVIKQDCMHLKSGIHVVGGGYKVYGHWLLDFLPRLARIAEYDLSLNPIIRKPDAGWAIALADCLLSGGASQHCVAGSNWIHVEKLIVPTTARFNYTLQDESVLTAWAMLKQSLTGGVVAPANPSAKRLFVSRRKLKRNVREIRRIANIGAVERVAESAGFTIISPETMPLQAQAQLFSNAEVIMGEDGSGLHNTIFSKPGTKVGIIGSRSNALHAAIAGVLDQKVYYFEPEMPGEDDEGATGSRVSIRKFKQSIDELVS